MSDLPYRDKIRHDDCSEIIEAWRSGRLIDRENIDYEAAAIELARWTEAIPDVEWSAVDEAWKSAYRLDVRTIVDAAFADKETTT